MVAWVLGLALSWMAWPSWGQSGAVSGLVPGVEGVNMPAAPEDGILDEAGLLSEAQRDRIREPIAKARARDGIDLYVVTYRVTPGISVEDFATGIKDSWARENDKVIVLIYDRLQHTMTFAASAGTGQIWTETDLQAGFRRTIMRSLASVEDSSDLAKAGELVATAAELLVGDSILGAAVLDPRPRRWGPGFEWLLASLVIGGGMVAGVAALFGSRQARTVARKRRRTVFPRVEVEARLGAKHSGGVHGSLGE